MELQPSITRCYTPAMSQRQRDHAKEYIRQLNLNKERNLGEKMCHGIAAAVAKEK